MVCKTLVLEIWGTFHTFQTFHSIPWVKKNEIFFFAFFLRIESFWLQKCNKKNLTRFFAFEVTLTQDLEFFWKFSTFSIFFFFRIELKNAKQFFYPIMRSAHLTLRIFSKFWKFRIFSTFWKFSFFFLFLKKVKQFKKFKKFSISRSQTSPWSWA